MASGPWLAGLAGHQLLQHKSSPALGSSARTLPMLRLATVLTVRSVWVLDRASMAGAETTGEGSKARCPNQIRERKKE